MRTLAKIIFAFISLSVIFLIIIWISYEVQILVQHKKYGEVFGYSLFAIRTNSMEPNLLIGDDIFVKITKDINANDIIVFENEDGMLVSHRVININGEEVKTKGDNNNTEDESITKDKVIGKVIHVFPKLGYVQNFFRKPYIFIPIIDLILITTIITLGGKKNEQKTKNIKFKHSFSFNNITNWRSSIFKVFNRN